MYSTVAGSLRLDTRAGGRQNNVCHKALAAGGDQTKPSGAAGTAREVMCWNVKRKSIMLYPEREREREDLWDMSWILPQRDHCYGAAYYLCRLHRLSFK